jgi:DNA-directed RNA polymerase subunit M/transcription elongation factor TFIIS
MIPNKETPSHAAYSKKVFELFKGADLPCSKGNEISFLQTDFKNALSYLHKTPEYSGISSEDVIGAVTNYISVYKDPGSYVTTKMNFYSLVKSKMFYNLLPANFDSQNFKKFGASNEHQEEQKPLPKTYRKCPKCGAVKLWYNNKSQSYFCDSCFSDVKGDEL